MSKEKAGVSIITGTAGALGSAVVKRFIDRRAEGDPVVVGLDIGYKNDVLCVDPDCDDFCTMRLDATRPDEVRRVFGAIREQLGPVRHLIHCAGGFRWSEFDAISDADLDFLLDVNLRSSLLVVREVLGEMKREQRGHIVLVSSRSTLSPGVGEGAYAATKAGINALVSSVSRELASSPCTINAVLPSILDTPANRAEMPDADHDTWVKLDQLAAIIHQFTTPMGAPLNGALLPVSGRT